MNNITMDLDDSEIEDFQDIIYMTDDEDSEIRFEQNAIFPDPIDSKIDPKLMETVLEDSDIIYDKNAIFPDPLDSKIDPKLLEAKYSNMTEKCSKETESISQPSTSKIEQPNVETKSTNSNQNGLIATMQQINDIFNVMNLHVPAKYADHFVFISKFH